MIKYVQILNDIRNKILDGTFKANEQLPFEKDLCNKYSASKILQFNVISSNKEIEKNLNLLEGDPVAIVTQTGFLENGRAFEYSTCVHSYKYFEFKTVIFR
ncbi:UTRA domain-containing protein [Clostridium neuense]|uniref:UTRA domain-containing protein n=1 Tax=Clostridium neuense TaxID=1728934 RepID=A0ABW8TLE6_9CLOT